MRAALFEGPGKLEIKDLSLKKLKKNELRIQVGLCGTDFHLFAGEAPSKTPAILDHEFVGTVVETCSNVAGFKIGDRAAVDPNIYCSECNYCSPCNIQFCTNLKALSVTLNSDFAEYTIIPSGQAYLIPKDFPFKIASCAEPLSCCVHGIDQASIRAGQGTDVVLECAGNNAPAQTALSLTKKRR